jgi:hypothetical protein
VARPCAAVAIDHVGLSGMDRVGQSGRPCRSVTLELDAHERELTGEPRLAGGSRVRDVDDAPAVFREFVVGDRVARVLRGREQMFCARPRLWAHLLRARCVQLPRHRRLARATGAGRRGREAAAAPWRGGHAGPGPVPDWGGRRPGPSASSALVDAFLDVAPELRTWWSASQLLPVGCAAHFPSQVARQRPRPDGVTEKRAVAGGNRPRATPRMRRARAPTRSMNVSSLDWTRHHRAVVERVRPRPWRGGGASTGRAVARGVCPWVALPGRPVRC